MKSNVANALELPCLEPGPASGSPILGDRLDLIGHVKVQLGVTIGGVEMPVGRLFELAQDEVITLDRSIDAPVDVVLNGKVIAQGSLVAVGDHFGVRITHIKAV